MTGNGYASRSHGFTRFVIFPAGNRRHPTFPTRRPIPVRSLSLFAGLLLAAPLNSVSLVGLHHPASYNQFLTMELLRIVGLQSSANEQSQNYGNYPL